MAIPDLVTLTGDIVASYVANNPVSVRDVPAAINEVHGALSALGKTAAPEQPRTPVVSVKASVKPDHLVCLECGKKQSMLKRHLMAAHGWSTEQYRAEFSLAPSYPMVSPGYSEIRRGLAKKHGLGRKR